jgi:1,5-anhydro-D-fructose reductase (1,5-anhydro-D-mannitol-forming)
LVRWGIIGCGDVCEVKSGPGFQKADRSALVAVMRRNRALAEDYARRHDVPRAYDDADALIGDPEVDAVYVATPPSSHCDLALRVAAAGKPCLVEKPMAVNHAECIAMVDAFRKRSIPLWVAYYRRALPRFRAVRDLVASRTVGPVTSVHITVHEPLRTGEAAARWRLNPDISGGGLFSDLASHCFDLVDFIVGPITDVHGHAINTGGAYRAEDVSAASYRAGGAVGTGIWNFNASGCADSIVLTGTRGDVRFPVFTDGPVDVTVDGRHEVRPFTNPPHVHQPLIQTIVDELHGEGRCPSPGETAARTSWVLEKCLEGYYKEKGARP